MTDDQVRHFNVLLEDIQRNVGVLAEGYTALNRKVDANHAELTAKVDRLDARMTVLQVDVAELKTDMTDVKQRLTGLEERPNGAHRKRPLKKK